MSFERLYLHPGFCLVLNAGQKITYFQLRGPMKRSTPVRLRIIDELNKGFDGDKDALIDFLNRKIHSPKEILAEIIEEIENVGFLTRTPPEPRLNVALREVRGTPPAGVTSIATPVGFVTQSGYYYLYSHEGEPRLRVTQPELLALATFSEATTVADAKVRYFAAEHKVKIGDDEFDDLVARVAGAGLFRAPRSAVKDDSETELFATVNRAELQALVDARVAAHDRETAGAGRQRVQVVPVNTMHGTTPASLGLLLAYAMDFEGGRLTDRYDFVPMFLTDVERLAQRASRPGVFLFSNYLWNVDANLVLSAAVKQANPLNITVHGGPSTPAYEQDCADFFRDNPHVDIAVRGEGERTLVDVLDHLDLAQGTGLERLERVAGISYRTPEGVRRTGDRERIADLDTIPSPYLNGLFEEFGAVRASAVIESNRGCPYGCTFCDWGSATLSKVRKFDLERVFAELEWSASHRVEDASIADANFGMLARDVDITRRIADLRKVYGYPNTVGINYAKNQVRYLRDIIRILAEVGILTEGKVSLQSMDAGTLKAIDRDNIKLSKYNELSVEFRRADLPLGVELMMGLPGSSAQSFRNDLQDCTNRDVRVQVNPTMVLPNSPMNAPEYREEHGIIARAGEFIKETSTYSREEWDGMIRLRGAYALLDTYGLVRYVARFVRGETGMQEIDFYDRMQRDVESNPARWPVLASVLRTMADYMAPPGSWSFYVEEVRDYAVSELGLPDDSGLRTALAVQLAHLPAADREFPFVLELQHDFTAWWTAMLEAREDGHREDWEQHIPRLREYGPATLTITDPNKICVLEIGKSLTALGYNLRTWELDSPVARARTPMLARAG